MSFVIICYKKCNLYLLNCDEGNVNCGNGQQWQWRVAVRPTSDDKLQNAGYIVRACPQHSGSNWPLLHLEWLHFLTDIFAEPICWRKPKSVCWSLYRRCVDLEFWVRVRRVVSVSVSADLSHLASVIALSAIVLMFKIYCQKKLQMQLEFCSIVVARMSERWGKEMCFSTDASVSANLNLYLDHSLTKLWSNHRLNGSSSPVLTATSLSYGKAKNSTPHRIKTPEPIEIKFGRVDYVG